MDEKKAEYRRLLKKAKRKSFLIHLIVYILIIGLLTIINLTLLDSTDYDTGTFRFWVIFPAIGWGIAIVIHAIETFFGTEDELRLRELEAELGLKKADI